MPSFKIQPCNKKNLNYYFTGRQGTFFSRLKISLATLLRNLLLCFAKRCGLGKDLCWSYRHIFQPSKEINDLKPANEMWWKRGMESRKKSDKLMYVFTIHSSILW